MGGAKSFQQDQANLCCLCITSCNEFKSLYDDNGQVTQFYEITVKYFDFTLLQPGNKYGSSSLLCLECWKHIYDFHSYQQSIIHAQSQLEHAIPIISAVKVDHMLPTAGNEVTCDSISVFDIIHINGEKHSAKFVSSQVSLSDSSKRDETNDIPSEINCEQINSVKRRKLKKDASIEMECVVCKESFASYKLLSTHFQSKHPDQEWNVVCCDRKFNNRWKVVVHLRQFHNQIDDNSYNCECCSASFSQYLSLKKHILKKHTAEALTKYICNYNSKSFKKQTSIDVKLKEDSTTELSPVHIRENDIIEGHFNELQDISSISIDSNDIDEIYKIIKEPPEKEIILSSQNQVLCSRIKSSNVDIIDRNELLFITNNDSNIIRSRYTISTDDETIDKLNDSNSCKKQTTLENDNLIAKFKEDLECPKCKEIFAYYSLLNEHFIREHPNVEFHIVCCKNKFYNISEIMKHLGQFHARNYRNAYSCKMCGASFTQYGSLRRHIRRKHAVQSLLKWLCNYCNREFKTRSSLESHKKKVHSKDISNINVEDSEDDEIDQMQDNIYYSSMVSNEDDDIYDENKKPSVYSPNETPYSSVTSNYHIQQPPLEIIDVKNEILISSDNESVSNFPIKITNGINESICETEQNILEYNELEYDAYIAKWIGDLKCPKCRQLFANFSSLDRHFYNEHQIENGCYIICCQTGLNNRRLIVEHLREYHKNPSGFRCDVCGKCFKSDRSLASHKRQVHIVKRSKYHLHLCYCKRSKEQESKNEALPAEYDTVICCERKQKTLYDDAIIAKWKPELKCRLCEATFSYYSLMHAHFYYDHPGEKCYIICCQRNFFRISDALEHIRIHLDPYAFKCELCNLPFAGKSSLSKHMRLIHGETSTNKFACDQCNKSFSQNFILTRHKNLCHTTQDG